MMRAVTLCSLMLWVSAAGAAELRSISVDHESGLYSVDSEVWFDAPVAQVFEVFRQWDLSTQFSSVIAESRDIEADELGRPQYFVRNEGCILFFCKSFVRQGHVELEVNEVLKAFADPELSDFKRSDETWRFSSENGGTAVLYTLRMEPDFWIPPLIGPYVIKRKFRSGGDDAIDRIEEIARDMAVTTGARVD